MKNIVRNLNGLKTNYIAAVNLDTITSSSKYTKISPSTIDSIDNVSSILRDPQNWTNFKRLLQICDYYINYDSMCSGAIKNILIPFSQASYRLVGGNQKNRKFYQDWLELNNFEDIQKGLANDYHKYGQGYIYLYDDGTLQVLPPFRCYIESMLVDGEPVVAFEIDRSREMSKTDMTTIERQYAGYPKEIIDAASSGGGQFAQLKLGNVFSVSGAKAYWEKYSLPIVTSALPWLVQKEELNATLINEMSDMQRSFLEVRVGDKETRPKPNMNEFRDVAKSYQSAVSGKGTNLAVVAWNVNSEWKKVDTKETLKSLNDAMSYVNWNILSALSMSPILAAGDAAPNKSSSSSFSTTQAAVAIVNKRINSFLIDFEKMMNKIIKKIAINNNLNIKSLPRLVFDRIDINNEGAISDELFSLYDKGLLSRKTLLEHTSLDFDQELELKQQELKDGYNNIFTPPPTAYNTSGNTDGAPVKDVDDRKTDPEEIEDKNNTPRPSTE